MTRRGGEKTMIRRNENASRRVTSDGCPSYAKASEGRRVSPVETKHRTGTMKTAGESIVREHRNSISDLIQTPLLERVYKAPWYKAINLDTAFNWVCWAAVIGCLIYLGIFVFAPFTAKLLR